MPHQRARWFAMTWFMEMRRMSAAGCGHPALRRIKKETPPDSGVSFRLYCSQKSALPTVRGCSSTSRMLLTPVRYMTIRSKPRPKPACLQEP